MMAPTLARSRKRSLSPRQAQVAELVAEGLRNQDIAARLGLAENTVRNQMARIFAKLGVTNRTMLALWLLRGRP
jgi:DNA-binding NarL/FixJ family response regulator